MYTLKSYTNPYFLTADGHFVPMSVTGMTSLPRLQGECGWTATAGQITVPLTGSAYFWTWTVRLGYLTDRATQATIVLGSGRHRVSLQKGLGEVYLPLRGGAGEVLLEDVNPEAHVCVGDVQVGTPVARK